MKKISLIAAIALASSSLGAASLEEAIKGVKVNGNSFIRHISNTGLNDGGSGYAMRFVLDLATGNERGFNFGGGLFYQYGGTPTAGIRSDGSVNGSRGDRVTGSGGNAFGISTLWAQYGWETANNTITVGKLKLATPISSGATDRGVGALATSNPVDGLTLVLGWFDSWAADNQYIGGIWTRIPGGTTDSGVAATTNMGNNITAVGINGDYSNFKFKAWYFNIASLANALFGEFKVGNDFSFAAQVAYTDVYNNPMLADGTFVSGTGFTPGANNATSRGLYTLQLAAKPANWFSAKAGFVGSFGDGYGVALNNTASFNIAGKWWYDNFGDGRNGFAYSGRGGKRDTHINVWYVAGKASVSIVDIGLDVVGISGKNQYATSKTSGSTGGVAVADRTFYEITPSFDINLAKGAKLSAYYAMAFGQIDAQRVWAQVSYAF